MRPSSVPEVNAPDIAQTAKPRANIKKEWEKNHTTKHMPCSMVAITSIFLLFHLSARIPDGISNIIVNVLQSVINTAISVTDKPRSRNKIM